MGVREAIEELERDRAARGADARSRRVALLELVRSSEIDDPDLLVRHHDTLLFLRAYPDDPGVLGAVLTALASFVSRSTAPRTSSDADESDPLVDSGLAGTRNVYTYSWAMARQLVQQHPGDLEIAWDDWEDTSRFYGLVSTMAHYAETPGIDDERTDGAEWLERARAGRLKTDLEVFLELLESSSHAPPVREALYDSLHMPVEWRLRRPLASRTTSMRTPARVHFHPGPMERGAPDLQAHLRRPLPVVERLSPRDAMDAIARIVAAMSVRNRELYPFDHPEPRDVSRIPLDRGLEIFVYGIEPSRRLLLETTYGQLVAKNGVPIGYALSSVLGDACEIGLNIYETYRQGENALLVAELMRIFHQLSGARYFFLPRRQLGYDNAEGLDSGAYWFYDKLGFRSLDPRIRRLAERERARIRTTSGYRSPTSVLTRLVREDVGLSMDPALGAEAILSTTPISLAVTDWIARAHDGDRAKAEAHAVRLTTRWLGVGREAPETLMWLARWAPLVALIPDRARWTASERTALLRIVRAKAGPRESAVIPLLRRHVRWMGFLRSFDEDRERG